MILSPAVHTASSVVRTFAFADTMPLRDTASGLRIFKEIARELVDKPIPDDVKAKAAMYAPQLVATMRENTRRFARHQAAGSLDTSKLVRLAVPSSAAQFERDAATAFRARAQISNNVPLKIAIVADMCWDNRCYDTTYAERVGTLSYIIGDAAACAGLQCATYGVRGRLRDTSPFDKDDVSRGNREKKFFSLISVLSNFSERAKPIDFSFHTSDNGYIYGTSAAMGGDQIPGSIDGTGGIDYAREVGNATFVVGLGEFRDRSRPDVQMPSSTPLHEAVGIIHAALAARQHRAAA